MSSNQTRSKTPTATLTDLAAQHAALEAGAMPLGAGTSHELVDLIAQLRVYADVDRRVRAAGATLRSRLEAELALQLTAAPLRRVLWQALETRYGR